MGSSEVQVANEFIAYREESFDMKERLACLNCQKTDNSSLKLMPCLHLYCFECLENLVDTNCIAMPTKDEVKCSIFSCPACGYVVRVINKDTNFLKSLQLYESCEANAIDYVKAPSCEDENDMQSKRICCDDILLDDLQLFCATCKVFLCANCLKQTKHDQHDFCSDDAVIENKRLNLQKLCCKMEQHRKLLLNQLHVSDSLCESMHSNKVEIKDVILARCEEIINKVNSHKLNVLSQLESIQLLHLSEQTDVKNAVIKDINSLDESLKFCSQMLRAVHKQNLVNIFDELTTHVTRILMQKRNLSGVIHHVMLEEMEASKEELLIEKLFGSLVIGSIAQNSLHLGNIYHTNISWPCCMATNTKEFMLAGKLETFGGVGKMLFSDRDMKKVKYVELQENCLPLDLLHLPDDTLLLSTNNGNISKYSFHGLLIDEWERVFEGMAGQMARLDQERFLVTSASNQLFVRNIKEGALLQEISLQVESPIRCMTSGNKLLYCILEDKKMKIFDFSGCPADSEFDITSYSSIVKCPSSLICDPFGNVLVSDFMNDSVHFFDRKGKFLGPILSKQTDSIVCPNKIILDSCGNLYVAQYGGDVFVFDYLSCAKKA